MKGQIVTGPDGERIVLVDVGQRVLLDDPLVRVWEVSLDPGQTQPWHLHHNPYVVLCLASSPGRMDWIDGSEPRFTREYVGGAVLRPVSPVHRLTNIGPDHYRNRLIELKELGEEGSGRAASPRPADINAESRSRADDSPGADPDLVLDNRYVRVWTVTTGADELPTDRDRVVVPIDDGESSSGIAHHLPGEPLAGGTGRRYVVELR